LINHIVLLGGIAWNDVTRQLNAGPWRQVSVQASRDQLDQINSELCDTFIKLWQRDLMELRRYLARLDRVDSIGSAFPYVHLDYAESPSPRTL
jgi:hypothetical protein